MQCRFCKTPLTHVFIDLVNSPASNSFLTFEQLNEPEVFYPLKVFTCPNCFLVQVDEYKKSDAIFNSEYVYFSSFSTSWLEHSRKYTDLMTEKFGLDAGSLVVELASNDGYLLQYFRQKGIPPPQQFRRYILADKAGRTRDKYLLHALQDFQTRDRDHEAAVPVPDIRNLVDDLLP